MGMRPNYHISPKHGFLNDPNGLAQFRESIMYFINGFRMLYRREIRSGGIACQKI